MPPPVFRFAPSPNGYLHLGHGDAWPAGDIAIQEAVKVGLGLQARPTAKQMAPLAEPWRPLRGAAAHLWWSYYHVLKKREGVLAG